jgi:hypothetical protein
MTPPIASIVSPTLQPVALLLAQVALAPQQSHKALTLWPLVLRSDALTSDEPGYVLLARALEDGSVELDEISDGGAVPHVRVTNRGVQDVLFLFGEEIRGAKQNRVANASFLVPARSELVVDVSCVEKGRWGRRGHGGFGVSEEVLSQKLRRKMAHRVAESRRRGDRFEADQIEVWNEIGARLERARAHSATDAYADYIGSRQSDLAEILAAGSGDDLRIEGEGVAGCALVAGELVHLTAFPARETAAGLFDDDAPGFRFGRNRGGR